MVRAICGLVVLMAMPVVCEAQGFARGGQFGSLAFGAGATDLTPDDVSWTDETFTDGLRLPSWDRGAPMIEFSLGVMTTDRLAVIGRLLDVTGASVHGVPGRLANFNIHGGVRYWIARRVWLEGALGPTLMRVLTGEDDAQLESGNWGWGVAGAVGYDLIQRRSVQTMAGGRGRFMLPVQVRITTTRAGGVRTASLGLLMGIVVG
jgi:hypothetical protein